MRFIGTVLAAAILIVLTYLFVGWMVDGYFGGNIVPDRLVPDQWAAPNSWSEWRDILIVFTFIFWMIAGNVTSVNAAPTNTPAIRENATGTPR